MMGSVQSVGMVPISSSLKSAAVKTATTPGMARAASVSIETMSAWASVERTSDA